MLIRLASVMVENQDSALRFYTTILGFVETRTFPWAHPSGG
jgi:catechol 2,3-dioxygenase-like lactoylglutathione lyase family enzyme